MKKKDRVMRAFIDSLRAEPEAGDGPTCGDPEHCLDGLPSLLEAHARDMAELARAVGVSMAKAGPMGEMNHLKAAAFVAAVYGDWKELIAKMDDTAFVLALCGAKMRERGRRLAKDGRARK